MITISEFVSAQSEVESQLIWALHSVHNLHSVQPGRHQSWLRCRQLEAIFETVPESFKQRQRYPGSAAQLLPEASGSGNLAKTENASYYFCQI